MSWFARACSPKETDVSIFVEIFVRAPMEALWAHTQTPALHERWDLRFSRIEYLPRAHDSEPQRFRYRTRVGFGFEVNGEGETVGESALRDGSRSSALRFGSASALSIISEGSGYWKYIPTADGIRFVTRYDYRTRFGRAGAVFDRVIFRPLLGWATAWSFDRLRLWLEQGVDPSLAARRALVHAAVRIAVAVIVVYHITSGGGLLSTVTLTSLVLADVLVLGRVPSARRCLRRPLLRRDRSCALGRT